MPQSPGTGLCILSIDLVSHDARAADLCRYLAAAHLPVTWSLSAPPTDDLREAIEDHVECEVALLAEPSWATEGSSRRDFSHALTDGLQRLASGGFRATTLVLPAGRLAAHDDLLVKQGITGVRVAESRQRSPAIRGRWLPFRSMRPANDLRPLRWGLWEAVVSLDLANAGLRGALRVADCVSREGGLAIIVAHCETLALRTKLLSRLVGHLTRRREEHLLCLDTLCGAVGRQRATPQTLAARSILHSAA